VYNKTNEDEDAIHVTLPRFDEGPVVLLAFVENDSPELRGRVHILDLWECQVRNLVRKCWIVERQLKHLEFSPEVQFGARGTYLGSGYE